MGTVQDNFGSHPRGLLVVETYDLGPHDITAAGDVRQQTLHGGHVDQPVRQQPDRVAGPVVTGRGAGRSGREDRVDDARVDSGDGCQHLARRQVDVHAAADHRFGARGRRVAQPRQTRLRGIGLDEGAGQNDFGLVG